MCCLCLWLRSGGLEPIPRWLPKPGVWIQVSCVWVGEGDAWHLLRVAHDARHIAHDTLRATAQAEGTPGWLPIGCLAWAAAGCVCVCVCAEGLIPAGSKEAVQGGWQHAVSCCVMLCHAVPQHVMLCHAVSCSAAGLHLEVPH
jgi:hypothetical protein